MLNDSALETNPRELILHCRIVRRITLEQLANDSAVDHESLIRVSLKDSDSENVRHAMWHLCRMKALTADDLAILLSAEQPDRVAPKTILASTIFPQRQSTGNVMELSAANGPLTPSLLLWSRSMAR